MQNPKITFFGGVGSTTGANFLVEFENNPTSPRFTGLRGTRKILIDCGLFQGTKNNEDRNLDSFKYNPAEINFLLITHAHLDHIGRVPLLVKNGFKGKIISTTETKELALPILVDAMKVFKTKHLGAEIFNEKDIENTLALWEGRNYGEKINLFDECNLLMQNAGHILGSAIMIITTSPPTPARTPQAGRPLTLRGEPKKTTRIAFTGDLGNSPSPLLPDAEIPKDVDYLVMESVYGDRNHESKDERREKLKKTLIEGIKMGGDIVIPTFSIERTQVLLYEINNMIENGEIPKVPVFLDSPLAEKITAIYKKYEKDFKDSVKEEIKSGDDIFDFPGLKFTKNHKESEEIENIKGPKIILAGSGMSEGGRVVNHEIRILDKKENTLILVGYQAAGTLGRRLEEGVKEITSPLAPPQREGEQKNKHHIRNFIKKIKVKAKIETIKGYSSHMDSEHLLGFVENITTSPGTSLDLSSAEERQGKQTDKVNKLKKVFVVMGEPKASLFLTQRIHDYLDVDAVYPEEGKEYELV